MNEYGERVKMSDIYEYNEWNILILLYFMPYFIVITTTRETLEKYLIKFIIVSFLCYNSF